MNLDDIRYGAETVVLFLIFVIIGKKPIFDVMIKLTGRNGNHKNMPVTLSDLRQHCDDVHQQEAAYQKVVMDSIRADIAATKELLKSEVAALRTTVEEHNQTLIAHLLEYKKPKTFASE